MSLETISSKTMDISIRDPKFMQQTRLALAVMAYLFHQLRPTQVQGNTKLTLQASLRIRCSRLWARKVPLTNARRHETRPFSPSPTMPQAPTWAIQTATRIPCSTRTRQVPSSNSTLLTIRDPTATSINSRAGTCPLLWKRPHNQLCKTNPMVSHHQK